MPHSIPKGLTREHILKALADLDAGIEHSFGTPTGYELFHDGKRYAPKAVIGTAFRHLTGQTLLPGDFSGGESPGQANYELRRLGFKVVDKVAKEEEEKTGVDWSDDEVGLLVTDYFDMLRLELIGQDFNKAQHNRMLREKLKARSKSSIEFKHRNVSAVILKLGLPYIEGYKPARNYQRSLVDSVKAHLESNQALFDSLTKASDSTPEKLPSLGSLDRIFEAPPDDSILPQEPVEPWAWRARRKIDYVRREAANRRLGSLGEKFAIELERRRLLRHGRDDLADKIEWVSDTRGDGLGFDVLSFDEWDDSERLIEVKTTAQPKQFPFFVSANEVRCSEAVPERYHLYRLFSFARRPRVYVLHGALSQQCHLDPITFRATARSVEAEQNAK